ncbi:Glucose-6-phosphate/phosphate translocator 1 [Durusdinium trenchii]
MPSRPLRGVVLLLAAVLLTVDWSFAVPKATRTKLTSQVGVELGQQVSLSPGNFAGRSFGAKAQDKVPDEASARSTDAVSLALAAAGCAVAMRAASAASEESEAPAEEKSFMDKYGVAIYIGLWYLFNIGYNIYNKKALISYPFPWACAMWQMTFGWLIFCPLWILRVRKTPKLTVSQAVTLAPAALGHLATHVGAVVAFFAGAVSFGHIVKASEPVVSSFLNFAFLGEVMPWQVYASLLPIIGGVGIASASELSFNWLCFGAAMGSNLGSASRAVYSKKVMKGDIGENMDSSNTFSVLTIMATFMLIPISLAIEGPTAMVKGFKVALSAGGSHFMWQMILSGFYYYMYNEVAFQALGKLDPVSHAVCNTMKRVVIIITAIFVFRNPVTPLGILGSCVAIAGTLIYSLAKNKYSKK